MGCPPPPAVGPTNADDPEVSPIETPAEAAPPPAASSEVDLACPGEMWSAAYPGTEDDFPLAAYVTCAEDAECTERVTKICCGSLAVAVNAGHAGCIEPRSPGASCRALCARPGPDETAPARTPACVEGSCRLRLDDGSAREAIHLPWNPDA
jgi:hypothetical protein